jgi:hypothetical protein
MRKVAGENYIRLPYYLDALHKKEIVRAVKESFPRAEIRLNPDGVEIYPDEPRLQLAGIEAAIRRVVPDIDLDTGMDHERAADLLGRRAQYAVLNSQTTSEG